VKEYIDSTNSRISKFADDTTLATTSRNPSHLVGYLQTYIGRLERWLRDWRVAINVSNSTALFLVKAARSIKNLRPMQFLGGAEQWFETARNLGVTFETQLSRSAHVSQVGKKTAQKLGVLGPVLNKESRLSVRNGVQLIRPMMDYACPIWRSAARSHVRNLQVLQFKCLHIVATAPWYVGNRQICEDLGFPFFANHIRVLPESFDTKLADAGNPLFRQLGKHLCRPRAD
jgi:hypothetical protein